MLSLTVFIGSFVEKFMCIHITISNDINLVSFLTVSSFKSYIISMDVMILNE
jgi:hypothetical protein